MGRGGEGEEGEGIRAHAARRSGEAAHAAYRQEEPRMGHVHVYSKCSETCDA